MSSWEQLLCNPWRVKRAFGADTCWCSSSPPLLFPILLDSLAWTLFWGGLDIVVSSLFLLVSAEKDESHSNSMVVPRDLHWNPLGGREKDRAFFFSIFLGVSWSYMAFQKKPWRLHRLQCCCCSRPVCGISLQPLPFREVGRPACSSGCKGVRHTCSNSLLRSFVRLERYKKAVHLWSKQHCLLSWISQLSIAVCLQSTNRGRSC